LSSIKRRKLSIYPNANKDKSKDTNKNTTVDKQLDYKITIKINQHCRQKMKENPSGFSYNKKVIVL
jgi:hypothetical protein